MIKRIEFEKPLTVTEYITVANQLLKNISVKVCGEVSEMKKASSGHVYFSLKDEKTGDVINCAIWKFIYQMCGVKIENGVSVTVSGEADIYGPRGTLTFKVKTIELVGEGALKKAYEQLKEKLHKEGLFDEEIKRAIPTYPERIGVITSLKGAAIHDFTNNLGSFGFKVLACDSRVEGQEAVGDLLLSMKVMSKQKIDVLVMIRGGGSLQSLMAFDNEMLVRAVRDFPVPVVAGIGHHEDTPLVALVSDAQHSTPTAVANQLSFGYRRGQEIIASATKRIERRYTACINGNKKMIENANTAITHFYQNSAQSYYRQEGQLQQRITTAFGKAISNNQSTVNYSSASILANLQQAVSSYQQKIDYYQKIISSSNPERQLQLGYSMLKKDGVVVRSINNLQKNDTIQVIIYDGEIESRIININKKKDE